MGKQSSRLYYAGRDHKDIYFRGKYHEAMYVGAELVWHKIRQEGYYSIMVPAGRRDTLVYIFNEASGRFEEIMKIEPSPESQAYDVAQVYAIDSERIYISTLETYDLIASSIDGINWGITNLETDEYFRTMVGVYNYFSDYMWYVHDPGGNSGFPYGVVKWYVHSENGKLSSKIKSVNTGLGQTSVDKRYAHMLRPFGRKSRIALHEDSAYTLSSSGLIEKTKTVISYYDVETETSGKICDLEAHHIDVNRFFVVNDVYLFFVTAYTADIHESIYVYYSHDGINYERALMFATDNRQRYHIPQPSFICYRNGMYYFYSGRDTSIKGTKNTIFLTSDFKHFALRYFNDEIKIGEETYYCTSLEPAEYKNKSVQYFYNGDRASPEDGMLSIDNRTERPVYIDNMFFRESNGNRVLEI